MRIAMVSEHASPLATLGSVDAGGQNVHVAALAAALGRDGHDVRVYTRRDSTDLPAQVEMAPGVTVVALVPSAGPVPPPMSVVMPAASASGICCGAIMWTWLSTPPAVRIMPLPARISVEAPIRFRSAATRANFLIPLLFGSGNGNWRPRSRCAGLCSLHFSRLGVRGTLGDKIYAPPR